MRAFFARMLGRQKPSLMVAIGRRRKGNALEEYLRRFEPSAGQDLRKPPLLQGPDRAKQPQRSEAASPPLQFDIRSSYRQDVRSEDTTRGKGGPGHFPGAAWALLHLAMLRSYHGLSGIKLRGNGLAVVMAGCAIALGGTYLYRTANTNRDGSIRAIGAGQPFDKDTGKAEGNPTGKKLSYARLTPEGQVTAPPAAPSFQAGPPKLPSASAENRADEPLSEGAQSASTPAISQTAAAERQAASQRTIVRSETYLPDGTRIDAGRPAPVQSIVRLGAGRVRPPFLAAAQPRETTAETAATEANSTPAAAQVQAAEPAPSLETGYFAQVKADQDQKAAEAELAAIVEKYKVALGDVPLKTRSVDLKEKGVWIRVLAGPLKSRDEAANLCKKLKSAGIEGCIIQKFD
jgi:hypothetical protein